MKNNEKELEEREIMITEEDMDENNNENRRFYVYEHIRKDNNTCFYVGKGTGNRAYNLDRGNFHNGVCEEYGCRVKIIKDGLTEEEAFKLERERIEDYVITFGYGAPIEGYDDYDHNLPYLTNFTWGGEGVSGRKHSEEEKQKMSKAKKGKKNSKEHNKNISKAKKGKKNSKEHNKNISKALKGIKLSEQTRRKMSESQKGRKNSEEHNKNISKATKGKNNPMYGKHHSEEVKRKMSKSQKGKKHHMHDKGKKVICITTGKIFNKQSEASNYYNVVLKNISCCCRGKRNYAGKLSDGTKLQWKFLKDYNNEFKGILINPITE